MTKNIMWLLHSPIYVSLMLRCWITTLTISSDRQSVCVAYMYIHLYSTYTCMIVGGCTCIMCGQTTNKQVLGLSRHLSYYIICNSVKSNKKMSPGNLAVDNLVTTCTCTVHMKNNSNHATVNMHIYK